MFDTLDFLDVKNQSVDDDVIEVVGTIRIAEMMSLRKSKTNVLRKLFRTRRASGKIMFELKFLMSRIFRRPRAQ